jgi:hypothetical protein
MFSSCCVQASRMMLVTEYQLLGAPIMAAPRSGPIASAPPWADAAVVAADIGVGAAACNKNQTRTASPLPAAVLRDLAVSLHYPGLVTVVPAFGRVPIFQNAASLEYTGVIAASSVAACSVRSDPSDRVSLVLSWRRRNKVPLEPLDECEEVSKRQEVCDEPSISLYVVNSPNPVGLHGRSM